jgi:serine/threonine protein kinase
MPFFFVYMEFCDLDLSRYMRNGQGWQTAIQGRVTALEKSADSAAKLSLTPDLLATLQYSQVRDLMKDICEGLQFIHAHH